MKPAVKKMKDILLAAQTEIASVPVPHEDISTRVIHALVATVLADLAKELK